MAQTIKLKRSATTGNAPTASQLALGELGINTTDGKLFLKKSVSGTESIVEVGGLPLSGGTLTGNLSLGDNVKLQLGNQTNGDLQIYHDGSNSYIREDGVGSLRIQGADLELSNPSEIKWLKGYNNNRVELFFNNAIKLATTSTGTLTTGTSVVSTSMMIGSTDSPSRDLEIKTTNPHIRLTDTDASGSYTEIFGGSGITTINADKGQNVSGSVLKLSVDATDGITIDSNHNVSIPNGNLDVTGSVVADGLTVDGDAIISGGSSATNTGATLQLESTETAGVGTGASISFKGDDGTGSQRTYGLIKGSKTTASTDFSGGLDFFTRVNGVSNATKRIAIASNGDISFYDSAGTSQNFYWDSSTSRLGLGVTNPVSALAMHGNAGTTYITQTNTANNQTLEMGNAYSLITGANGSHSAIVSDHTLLFGTSNTERLRINADGSSVFSGSVSATSGNYTTSGTASLADGTNGLRIVREGGDGAGSLGNGITFAQRWWSNSTQNVRTGAIFGKKINGSGSYGGGLAFYSQPASGADMVEALSIDSSQRVNIGSSLMVGATTAPSSRFHLKSASRGSFAFRITDSDTTNDILRSGSQPDGDGFLQLRTVGGAGNVLFDASGDSYVNGGNFGIGTALPTSYDGNADNLVIGGESAVGLTLASSATNGRGSIYFADGTSGDQKYRATINYFHDSDALTITTAAQERMRIFSDGDVSIGMTYNYAKLNVNGDIRAENSKFLAGRENASAPAFAFHDDHDTGIFNINPNILGFATGGQEAARIDASQNFLVGKTSSDLGATAGIELNGQYDVGYFTRSSEKALVVSRLSNDGTLMDFRRDNNTTVGSIQSRAGVVTTVVLNPASGNGAGLSGGTKCIVPADEAGIIDNDISLGISTHRFKDLYLSNNATAQKLTLTKDPVGTYSIEVDGTNTGQPNLIVKQSTNERFRCDNNGNLLVGSSSTPSGSTDGTVIFASGTIASYRTGAAPAVFSRNASNGGEVVVIQQQGTTVGSIGTTGGKLEIDGPSNNSGLRFHESSLIPRKNGDVTNGQVDLGYNDGSIILGFRNLTLSNAIKASTLKFENSAGTTEYARFDSSNNLLVGTTDATLYSSTSETGTNITSQGGLYVAHNGTNVPNFNRITTDGDIVKFRKDGTTVGSISSVSGISTSYNSASGTIFIGGDQTNHIKVLTSTGTGAPRVEPSADNAINLGQSGARFKDLFLSGSVNIGDAKTVGHGAISLKYDLVYMTAGVISPADDDGSDNDNSVDLGKSAARFNDIFATNGTIQTSDRNEKQDIESLTEAEERVAVAAKNLLKKFRWKSAVEEKGDDARIHFGIIAQDLQAAFEAEGLDAGRYGMFTSNTWTNEDGEEQTRMGVRYSELLAFIISAI